MAESVYTEDLKDDTDLSLHDPTTPPNSRSAKVSSDTYAWVFVVGAIVALWVIGRSFRSVNS